ncbi:MAG: hypothetical protein IK020_01795 [Clostridiales bacterium]|nr:hypothetical protein [Clostridiales bacterium]
MEKIHSPYTDNCDIRKYFEKKIKSKLPKFCRILKKSIDARHKQDIRVVISALFTDEPFEEELMNPDLAMFVRNTCSGDLRQKQDETTSSEEADKGQKSRVVVCGSGPAGLFAAMTLLACGVPVILLERGEDIDTRTSDVTRLKEEGILNIHSNVQFGEGGAGTFSDGKLFSGVSDGRKDLILRTFVRYGAPKSILFDAHPHIGTDILRIVVKNMRKEIQKCGGQVLFGRKMTDIGVRNGRVVSVTHVASYNGGDAVTIPCRALILAIGHSARDTFHMLAERNVDVESKPFAVGVRIEHRQESIDRAQFGDCFESPVLHPANYKVVTATSTGRKLYSFCMCPGGEVVCGSSEEGGVVTNGMSEYARDKENANSAMLVGCDESDFGSDGWDGGIVFQRELEKKAYVLGKGGYYAPAQRVGDFHAHRTTTAWGNVTPSYRPGVVMSNLWEILPHEIAKTIDEGLVLLQTKIRGFDDPDAVLTAVETRSSSPVRIRRDERGESVSVAALYPTGEGAGYAGGIMSSAIDGIRQAEALIKRYFRTDMVE